MQFDDGGRRLVDRLAAAKSVSFKIEKVWRAEVAKVADSFLCKPLTYMNLGGAAVRSLILVALVVSVFVVVVSAAKRSVLLVVLMSTFS